VSASNDSSFVDREFDSRCERVLNLKSVAQSSDSNARACENRIRAAAALTPIAGGRGAPIALHPCHVVQRKRTQ
jgi:hypothetical protein